MKKNYHFFLVIFLIPFFTACSSNNIKLTGTDKTFNTDSVLKEKQVVNQKNIISDFSVVEEQEIVSKKRSFKDKFSEAMNLRKSLYLKGMDYVPWEETIDRDIAFMKRLKVSLKKGELRKYNIKGYKFVSTVRSHFISNKSKTIYINHKSSLDSIKKFLKKNQSKLKRTKYSSSTVKVAKSNNKDAKKQSEPVRLIDFRSRNILGEYNLLKELKSISYNECKEIYTYSIYPTNAGKIVINHNHYAIYIDTAAVKDQIIDACK